MLDHIHLMDQRMEAMSKALEQRGITGHFNHLPDLEACEIVSAAEGPTGEGATPAPIDRSAKVEPDL
jgi:serine O-acetyltransferase